jgi:hypothetical protein
MPWCTSKLPGSDAGDPSKQLTKQSKEDFA